MNTNRIPLKNRFMSKVNKDGPIPAHCPELGPCWIWTGALKANQPSHQRYGVIGFGGGRGKTIKAHQASWIIHFGTIPDGQSVLHKCDNAQCVNPNHLWLGTQRDNLRDMASKNRSLFGTRGTGAKLTVSIVRSIIADDRSQRIIAAEHAIAQQSVSEIKSGKTWSKALSLEVA